MGVFTLLKVKTRRDSFLPLISSDKRDLYVELEMDKFDRANRKPRSWASGWVSSSVLPITRPQRPPEEERCTTYCGGGMMMPSAEEVCYYLRDETICSSSSSRCHPESTLPSLNQTATCHFPLCICCQRGQDLINDRQFPVGLKMS